MSKYTKHITVGLTEKQHAFLINLSKRDDVTPNWIMRRALENYMSQGVSVDPLTRVDNLTPPRFAEPTISHIDDPKGN